MNDTIRIETVLETEAEAREKFPESEKEFKKGMGNIMTKAAGVSAKIFLEGKSIIVDVKFPNEKFAKMMLPLFKRQATEMNAKEQKEKGKALNVKVKIV